MKIYLNRDFLIFSILFAGCASLNDQDSEISVSPEKKIYDLAQERLQSGSYSSAIEALEALERRFPFGKYAEQAQAELILSLIHI